jgi:hypothetical protein
VDFWRLKERFESSVTGAPSFRQNVIVGQKGIGSRSGKGRSLTPQSIARKIKIF